MLYWIKSDFFIHYSSKLSYMFFSYSSAGGVT